MRVLYSGSMAACRAWDTIGTAKPTLTNVARFWTTPFVYATIFSGQTTWNLTWKIPHVGQITILIDHLQPVDSNLGSVCFVCFALLYFVFSIPFIAFACLSLLVVTQIWGHIAGSPPPSPLRFVPCIFVARGRQPFLPSSTRVELRLPTLGALSSWSFFYFCKYTQNLTTVRFELQDQRWQHSRVAGTH